MSARVQEHEANHTRARRQGALSARTRAATLRRRRRRRRCGTTRRRSTRALSATLDSAFGRDAALGGSTPSAYTSHEPTHTGVWPHHCPTCKKGHQHHRRASQQACCRTPFTAHCIRVPRSPRQPLLPSPIQVQLRQGVQGPQCRSATRTPTRRSASRASSRSTRRRRTTRRAKRRRNTTEMERF